MDASRKPAPLTVQEALPWTGMTFDYTDKLIALIPEDKLDWRPQDPSGGFFFSLSELAMHIADARLMFARQLSGRESEEGYWSRDAAEGEAEGWYFRAHGGLDAILVSLALAREELGPWLQWPAERMNEPTDGTRKALERGIRMYKDQGKEPDPLLIKRGPASVMRVIMALCVHESGHRGALQTLLRELGVGAGFDALHK